MTGTRRPDGALENAILAVLWSESGPLHPAVIRERLSIKLAYTSVATVLVRLVEKGVVARQSSGKAFLYSAAVDEATFIARRMAAVLETSSNRRNALAGFVGQLGKRDARLLKALIDRGL